ncbi:MAG: VanZ family protein [Lachnospiraceae bacterium]|nr:VanZ family protein [Lachnospiraceae bacterium]
MILLAYLLGIVFYALQFIPVAPTALQIKGLRAIGFFKNKEYISYINTYVNFLVLFIPIGFLIPFIRGRKCFSLTIIFSIFLLASLEASRAVFFGGIISIDDELWTIAGAMIGYGFFSPVCVMTGLGKTFLSDNDPGFRWIFFAILFATALLFLKYIYEDTGKDAAVVSDNTQYKGSEASSTLNISNNNSASGNTVSPAKTSAIYDTLYRELSSYKESVLFNGNTIEPQDIFDQFVLLMNDHPEFFWLTGSAEVDTVTYPGISKTMDFKPEYADPPAAIPPMAKALKTAVTAYVSHCPEGSEYDKALWVHDTLIQNTEYASAVLYYAQTENKSHFDYAYTSYGALVSHKAVCAGYARAYQLILNALGIECGYVTGTALNTHGQTEDHAWNYVRLDGIYYFTDVTWDDPVSEDYGDLGKVSHDYFCLSTDDMAIDHFPDKEQFLPACPVTRSPY